MSRRRITVAERVERLILSDARNKIANLEKKIASIEETISLLDDLLPTVEATGVASLISSEKRRRMALEKRAAKAFAALTDQRARLPELEEQVKAALARTGV